MSLPLGMGFTLSFTFCVRFVQAAALLLRALGLLLLELFPTSGDQVENQIVIGQLLQCLVVVGDHVHVRTVLQQQFDHQRFAPVDRRSERCPSFVIPHVHVDLLLQRLVLEQQLKHLQVALACGHVDDRRSGAFVRFVVFLNGRERERRWSV